MLPDDNGFVFIAERRKGMIISGSRNVVHGNSPIARDEDPRGLDFGDALLFSGAAKVLKIELRGPYGEAVKGRGALNRPQVSSFPLRSITGPDWSSDNEP